MTKPALHTVEEVLSTKDIYAGGTMCRIRVDGGWLYWGRIFSRGSESGSSQSLCFVADAEVPT